MAGKEGGREGYIPCDGSNVNCVITMFVMEAAAKWTKIRQRIEIYTHSEGFLTFFVFHTDNLLALATHHNLTLSDLILSHKLQETR